MYLTITAIEKDKVGTHDATRIEGTKLDDGSPWSKKIPNWEKEVLSQLNEFSVGENVDVKLVRSGKYWNVETVTKLDAATAEKAKAEGGSSGGATKGQSGGYKSSTWNGRTGEAYDRSAAIYLAFDYLKTTSTDAQLKKLTLGDVVKHAEGIFEYMHNGVNPFVDPLDPITE